MASDRKPQKPGSPNEDSPSSDSVDALFDALQAAKRKKEQVATDFEIDDRDDSPNEDTVLQIKRWILIGVGLGLIAFGSLYAVEFLRRKTAGSGETATPTVDTEATPDTTARSFVPNTPAVPSPSPSVPHVAPPVRRTYERTTERSAERPPVRAPRPPDHDALEHRKNSVLEEPTHHEEPAPAEDDFEDEPESPKLKKDDSSKPPPLSDDPPEDEPAEQDPANATPDEGSG